ncbi:MAG: phosphatidate cytidylyltransferase [Ignavibacteriaceae bacterium]|nr:phosphatidate cytidylyltransferase [Ignavibacteriaceae bacterium]
MPSISPNKTIEGSTIGLRSAATASISLSVIGTKPQFGAHALLYTYLTFSSSALKSFMLISRMVIPARCFAI